MRSNVDEAPRPHGEGVSVQENPFLEVRDIVKNFGGVRALDGVNMAVWPGEVLCLAGENGCGKSTLIKVISGVHAPDAGRILIDGHTVSSLTPLSAMDAGIQVIYQDFSLFSNLTVAENIMMTSSVTEKKKFFSSTSAKQQAAQIVERLGVPLPLDADVEQLSVADKQLTAICRALAGNAKLLIMDEPTSYLDVFHQNAVLSLIKKLNNERKTCVIFISHHPDHALAAADKTLLLNGPLGYEFGATDQILKGENYKIDFSRFSNGGKYMSFNVSVFVKDDLHRNEIFERLKAHFKYVL